MNTSTSYASLNIIIVWVRGDSASDGCVAHFAYPPRFKHEKMRIRDESIIGIPLG